MLDFARPIKFDLAPVDVNALCEDAARAVHATEGAPVAVTLELDPELTPIVTDGERAPAGPGQHPDERAPRRARPGQRLQARPESIRLDDDAATAARACRHRGSRPGHRASSRTISPRVFDPYFTTRRTGTGLGLAISQNIIEGLGGTITVSSRPGSGTDVRIELPGASAEASASSDRPASGSDDGIGGKPLGGVTLEAMTTGSILLVDDEAKILNALAAALRGEGHEVVATGSAREAQRLLGQRLFDVLVVDNLMPELTGTDLIRELVASTAAGRAAADPDDDGARDRRERDRGDEAWRARLPAEAVRGRRAAGPRQPRARASAAAAPSTGISSASATPSSITTASSAAAAACRR